MNLILFLIILGAFYSQDFKPVFWLAFIIGLLTDLIFGNLVGFSSLLFLLICFLIYLYRRKFSSSHLLFQLSFLFLADWLFTRFSGGTWLIKRSLLLILAGLIIFPLINKMVVRPSGLELEV